ncbi:MAG: hypothetical protein LIP08_02960 [Bacteroides sp.]|nr:hypothetical protein [Bacteroides sp.]
MKQLLLLTLICCLPGCKTHRQTELDIRQQNQYIATYLATQMKSLQVESNVRENLNQELSGHITFFSPPDSSGNQHKVAEMDFNTNTTQEKQSQTQLQEENATIIQDSLQLTTNTDIRYHEEKITEPASFPFQKIGWIILGCLLVGGVINYILQHKGPP